MKESLLFFYLYQFAALSGLGEKKEDDCFHAGIDFTTQQSQGLCAAGWELKPLFVDMTYTANISQM